MDHFRNFFLNLRNGGNNMEDDEEEDLLSNEFESMDEEESDNRISFNKNLPSSHNYLSFDTPITELDLKDIIPCSLPPNEIVHIPLLVFRDIVLFPNQRLPLRSGSLDLRYLQFLGIIQHEQEQQLFDINSDKPNERIVKSIGIINELVHNIDKNNIPLASVGVTVKLSRVLNDTVNQSYGVLFEGNERFLVLKTYYRRSILWGKVILLEESLDSLPVPSQGHRQLSTCTIYPNWIQQNYSPELLFKSVIALATGILKIDILNHLSPTEGSFWVARNLTLDNLSLQKLLEMTTPERLKEEIAILESYSQICCRNCRTHIGDTSSIFSMSKDGPQSSFVNRHGFVHDTITLRSLKAQPILIGNRPSTQDSWFAGYSWIIILCPVCSSHLGWKYIRTQPNLTPASFWGLTRTSVTRLQAT